MRNERRTSGSGMGATETGASDRVRRRGPTFIADARMQASFLRSINLFDKKRSVAINLCRY